MWHIENDIQEILSSLPSECSYIDYKQIPYQKQKRHDFVKDVIAMLNSSECIGKRKYIIFGVTDEKQLVGIRPEQQVDDNEFQNWADDIVPRPQIQTGTVKFEDKLFGYICILESNDFDIYEAGKTVCCDPNLKSLGKNAVFQGQAFMRRGSRNQVMMHPDREQFIAHSRLNIQHYIQNDVTTNRHDLLLTVSAILGAWDERKVGDQTAIEKIYGDDFSGFQSELRDYNATNHGVFSFSGDVWMLNDRIRFLQNIASRITGDHLKKVEELTCSVLLSTDHYLDLIKNHNDEVTEQPNITGYHYSDALRKKIFEFWAFLGNNKEFFSETVQRVFGYAWNKIVKTLMKEDDSRVWDANTKVLSLIAETYPYIFLRELEEAIHNKRPGILHFITEDMTYALCDAIAFAAMYKDTFSKAGLILIELGECNECFVEKLITVMLPWLPLTEADIDARIGLLKAGFQEKSDLTWKVLVQLLPNKRTTSIVSNKPLFYRQADIPTLAISGEEYGKAIDKLILLACEKAEGNSDRIVDLIPAIDDISEDGRRRIVRLIRENCISLSDSERYKIWMKIIDFVAFQKRCSDEYWARRTDRIKLLEDLTSFYEKKIWFPQERRLFRNDQWDLIDDYDDFEGSEKKISEMQDIVATRIYDLGEEILIKFISNIENQEVFGRHLANVHISESCVLKIIGMIDQEKSSNKRFAIGFVRGAYFHKNEVLLEYLKNEQPQKSIKVYEHLLITSDSITCAEQLDDEHQVDYWKKVDVYKVVSNEEVSIEFVIQKLIEVGRDSEVLNILYTLLNIIKKDISPDLISDILLDKLSDTNSKHDGYLIGRLIDYIQKSKIDNKKKQELEWKYLELITHEQGCSPQVLFEIMGKEPAEFMRIFSSIYRGESNDTMPPYNANVFSLLDEWRITPGTRSDGTMDDDHLKEWVEEVLALSDLNQRRRDVEAYIGKLLFYAPMERDGFFISKAAASILHSDINGYIRGGYLNAAICSRGVHWLDETGAQEFELEKQYNQKAILAEREGYTRFADTLRMIAIIFHDEAIHNVEEAKKWSAENKEI